MWRRAYSRELPNGRSTEWKSSFDCIRWFWDFARSIGQISIIDWAWQLAHASGAVLVVHRTRKPARTLGAIPFFDWGFKLCHSSGAVSAVCWAWEFPNADRSISIIDWAWSFIRAATKKSLVGWAYCRFFDTQTQYWRALSRNYSNLDALPRGLCRGGGRQRSGVAGSPVGCWQRGIKSWGHCRI